MAIDEKKLIDKEKLLWEIAEELYYEDTRTPEEFIERRAYRRIWQIIESQPELSLETKTSDKWIPASEPPKESGAYYVTIDDSFAKELKVYIAVYDGSKWQTWANVIAWMPLPEAYKGEE